MAYKKIESEDKGIGLFLDILNTKEINAECIEALTKKHTKFQRISRRYEPNDLIEILGEIKKEIASYAALITESEVDGAKAANDLVEWCNGSITPRYEYSEDISMKIVISKTYSQYDLDSSIADEIITTFTQVSFSHLKTCVHCKKYFLANRSNAQYCSLKCIRRSDQGKNKTKYARILRSRRVKGIYVPEKFFFCKKCDMRVYKTDLIKRNLVKKEFIHCPNPKCKAECFNPYHLLK